MDVIERDISQAVYKLGDGDGDGDGDGVIKKAYKRTAIFSKSAEIATVTNGEFFYTKDEFDEVTIEIEKNVFLPESVGTN